ncbi:IS630 family transposase [Ferroacidibacillus organovorans]|uniref:IS630 family transposase n=1 Tax=Ferroacidibacillus organovorans TaxID=1765683 RepID=UPI000A5E10A7|nr:IS630 family transposase [Ferroacidibacillus organovorans]
MPFQRSKTQLEITQDQHDVLSRVSSSRTDQARRVERAKLLLLLDEGQHPNEIGKQLSMKTLKIYRLLNKALELGPIAALDDLKRSGRPPEITPDAHAWITSLACQKPKDLGYSYEVWTTRLLSRHVREKALYAGHPSAVNIGSATISRLLSGQDIKPHKVEYYLERRDPDFDEKMAQVLIVYQQVEWCLQDGSAQTREMVVVSYDEKPGIQAIGNTAPDLPPVPGKHATVQRDHEYVRYGTLSLLAGIDLMTGRVIGSVEDRHRSCEFVAYLKKFNEEYPNTAKIQFILDNHSAHTSKETRAYLQTVPNRFEFVFTPKHAS